MTNQKAVKIIIDSEAMVCPECGNDTFRPSNMFFSHMRKDSVPNEVMVCMLCHNVINISGAPYKVLPLTDTEIERKRIVKLILDELMTFPNGASSREKIAISIERSCIAINSGLDQMSITGLETFLSRIKDLNPKRKGENYV